MELNEYQRRAQETDQRPGDHEEALVFPLMGLASEVGSLINHYKKRVRDGEAFSLFSDRVSEELGDILWYAANLAAKLGLSLDELASMNLRRTSERWPGPGPDSPSRLLDEACPETEQLPRTAIVNFSETLEAGRPRVRIEWNGQPIGDSLIDMAWEDDSYRFHDAFHLAYAALLGWSPISRGLFKRQRVSNVRVREVEDSGRAKVIEEAIAAIAFEYARQNRFLQGVNYVDSSILRTITDMTSGYEVRIRTVREWERAILRSFDVWRELRDHHGGSVHLDLIARSVRFEPLSR